MLSLKRILVALLLALTSFSAQASFTVNQTAGNTTAASSITISISIPSGHSVIVWTYSHNGGATIGSVTDSAGNTYTLGNVATLPTTFTTGTAWSLAIPSSITSVTYTPSGTAGDSAMTVWDITATGTISAASSAGAVYNFNTTTTTDAFSAGSLSISSSDGLLLAGSVDASGGSTAVGTGFTSDITYHFGDYQSEHKAVTSSGVGTFTAAGAGHLALAAGVALQVGGGSSCTHNFWSSSGSFSQPNGTSGSYWNLATGAFSTPNCSTGTFWRSDGASAAN